MQWVLGLTVNFGTVTRSTSYARTTVSPVAWPFNDNDITVCIHDIEITISELQAIFELQFTKEELEKMLVAYRLTKKSLESHG